jgi:hypothetical protein
LYKAYSFESGSENSFERMWCIPNGFCILVNGRRTFSETPFWKCQLPTKVLMALT